MEQLEVEKWMTVGDDSEEVLNLIIQAFRSHVAKSLRIDLTPQ